MDYDYDKKQLTSSKKQGKYNILKSIGKILLITICVLLQISVIYLMYKFEYIKLIVVLFQVIALSYLSIRNKISDYKLTWAVIILIFPGLGTLMYFIAGNNYIMDNTSKEVLSKDFNVIENDKLKYFKSFTKYAICCNKEIKYFSTGEEFFKDLEQELNKAKKYIFIETYILSKGILFDHIINILEKKSNQGVRVEIIADSFGSLFKISKIYKRRMEKAKIYFRVYNTLKNNTSLSDYFLHRDHKKIMIIDGKVAYLGGINIADEYINQKEMYNKWKDGGIKVYGNVVFNYLNMYLDTKAKITNEKLSEDRYINKKDDIESEKGYNISYEGAVEENQLTILNMFVNIINNSKKYLYIATPYFVPNETILNTIKSSAISKIDVRVIVPHIPDKKIVQYANRSFYKELLDVGIKVYEYKGFIHTKYIITEEIAAVGTANLDYKSIYFNNECMNLAYKTKIENVIKEDFENTIEESIEIKKEEWEKRGLLEKLKECIGRFMAPLL